MTQLLFTNNAQTTLAGSISNTATVFTVAPGGGAIFPNPGAGQGFYGTFTDTATGLVREIVLVTGRAGDTMTAIRAQQGTSGLNWAANDLFAKLWTAGDAQNFPQFGDLQSQTANYAVDTGSANAYSCTLNPAISLPVIGMPIRVKIANTNNGASTFNPGSGVAPVTRRDGSPCIGGEIIAGVITEFMWTGTSYNIMNGPGPAAFGVVGSQTDTDSFITPANLQAAFPFVFTSTGYLILPGTVGVRGICEWGNTGTINTGNSGAFNNPITMTGGLLVAIAQANFNVPPAGGGTWGTFGGGPGGITVVNQTGGNGSFNVWAFGRV